jgi:transposase-like protein
MLRQATEVRDQIVRRISARSRRAIVDAGLTGGRGHDDVAHDLDVLVRMLRERWRDIASTGALHAAEALHDGLSRARADRARQEAIVAEAAHERVRAYTLVVRTYEQLRRAVMYLRWDEGDADRYVPFLWTGRGRRATAPVTITPRAPPA